MGVQKFKAIIENVDGAGEGNRTLVFSLEGFRQTRINNVRYDKSPLIAALSRNGYSDLSEWLALASPALPATSRAAR
jgi:hypothetical protein